MRKGVASFCGLAGFVISVLAGARSAPAQQPTGQVVKLGEGETLTISGFINATMFTNSGLFGGFGQGQNAEFAAAPASQPTTDKLFSDGDVRNTRINFTFSAGRSEEHTSELQSQSNLVCRLLLEKKKNYTPQ